MYYNVLECVKMEAIKKGVAPLAGSPSSMLNYFVNSCLMQSQIALAITPSTTVIKLVNKSMGSYPQ